MEGDSFVNLREKQRNRFSKVMCRLNVNIGAETKQSVYPPRKNFFDIKLCLKLLFHCMCAIVYHCPIGFVATGGTTQLQR